MTKPAGLVNPSWWFSKGIFPLQIPLDFRFRNLRSRTQDPQDCTETIFFSAGKIKGIPDLLRILFRSKDAPFPTRDIRTFQLSLSYELALGNHLPYISCDPENQKKCSVTSKKY